MPSTETTDGEPITRSQRVRAGLLAAAASELEERGFAALTMESIAARAGASKATLYRHWRSKAAIAMDAFMAEVDPAAPFPDTGNVVVDFRRQLNGVIRLFRAGRVRAMLLGVLIELPGDAELRAAYLTRYVQPRRAQASIAIDRAIARGELNAAVDHQVLFDALYGAIYFRVLTGGTLDRSFGAMLVEQTFTGLLR